MHRDDPAFHPARPAPKNAWVRLSAGDDSLSVAGGGSSSAVADAEAPTREDWIADGRFDSMHTPRRLLLGYEEDREDSPLGRVFDSANSMHDHLDAIVVLGDRNSTRAARSLVSALVQPHWNELSRSRRGSKPRIYFVRPESDDEVAANLRGHLRQTCDNAAGHAGLIVIESSDPTLVQRHVIDDWKRFVAEGVATTNSAASAGDRLIGSLKFQDGSHPLGIATLLPCAMVAVDCVKLLDGAMRISDGLITGRPPTDLLDGLLRNFGGGVFYRSDRDCLRPMARFLSTVSIPSPGIVCHVDGGRVRTDRVFDDAIAPPPPKTHLSLPGVDSFTIGQWIGAEWIRRMMVDTFGGRIDLGRE